MIPDLKALQDNEFGSNSPLYSVLDEIVTTLCSDLGWLRVPTTKQNFRWGIIASCCEKIPITKKKIDWVHTYECVMTCLGKIYNSYFKGKELPEEKCLLSADEFPEEITQSPSDHIRKYECTILLLPSLH